MDFVRFFHSNAKKLISKLVHVCNVIKGIRLMYLDNLVKQSFNKIYHVHKDFIQNKDSVLKYLKTVRDMIVLRVLAQAVEVGINFQDRSVFQLKLNQQLELKILIKTASHM